jgi:hypothetical protein
VECTDTTDGRTLKLQQYIVAKLAYGGCCVTLSNQMSLFPQLYRGSNFICGLPIIQMHPKVMHINYFVLHEGSRRAAPTAWPRRYGMGNTWNSIAGSAHSLTRWGDLVSAETKAQANRNVRFFPLFRDSRRVNGGTSPVQH